MRILVLGGTGFIGPHLVRAALAHGHQVTLFNRGRTAVSRADAGDGDGLARAGVESRTGDRMVVPGDYASLADSAWDVAIDLPTIRPRWVREAAAALAGRVAHYVFISTISVYASHDTPDADEDAPLATTSRPDLEAAEELLSEYGGLKVLCEQAAQQAFQGRSTIVRPGLIVGPGDPTDRFSYWPVRVARGGQVLAPPADDPVQFIDVRDLAAFILRCAEERIVGVFNATGPAATMTTGQMLTETREALGASATFTHATAEFLAAQDPPIRMWADMPVWVAADGESRGFSRRSIARALKTGLTFRPFADTVRDTFAWFRTLPAERQAPMRAGLAAEREASALSRVRPE